MWRVLAGFRPLTRNAGRSSAFRFYSSAKPKKMGMKELAKEYGWTATGVYVALSMIDLPLAYLLVHSAGQERMEDGEIALRRLVGADTERDHTYIHKAAAGGKSLFLAEFGIAYIIHKCFIVFRVPLTVALTPAVARKLELWGFNVKRSMPKLDKEKLAEQVAQKAANSNNAAFKNVSDRLNKSAQKIDTNDISKTRIPPSAPVKGPASGPASGSASGPASGASTGPSNGPTSGQPCASRPDFGEKPRASRRWWWFF